MLRHVETPDLPSYLSEVGDWGPTGRDSAGELPAATATPLSPLLTPFPRGFWRQAKFTEID